MNSVLDAKNWKEREKNLSMLYTAIAKLHNSLQLTKQMPTIVSSFHDRPYLVTHGGDFAFELRKRIKDRKVKKIKLPIGSVNQFSNSTDLLESDATKLKSLYFK